MIRILTTRLLHIALESALLFALLSMPNHILPMQAMPLDTVTISSSTTSQGNMGEHSSGSCCDAMGTFSLACDFMVSQSACIARDGGSNRVVTLVPVIQSISLETVTPPPKA